MAAFAQAARPRTKFGVMHMLAYVVAPENLTSVLVRLINHVLGLSLLLTTVRQTAPRPNKYRSVYPGRLQPHTIPRKILSGTLNFLSSFRL